MKSVWVVTQGRYSDYRIVAVFETEAEAKQFTGGFEETCDESIDVDEWPLGSPKEGECFQLTYVARIAMSDGHLLVWWDGHKMIEVTECVEMHPRDWSKGQRRSELSLPRKGEVDIHSGSGGKFCCE